MNYRYVTNQLALLLVILAGVLIVVGGIGALFEEAARQTVSKAAMQAIFITAAAGALFGGGTWFATRFRKDSGEDLAVALARREKKVETSSDERLVRAEDDRKRRFARLGQREALLLVAMTWILGAAFCALPYLLWAHLGSESESGHHALRNFVNCYFEAMSGVTTTGATILSDIHVIPRSLLLWRSMTHWLGGLGIVVLFVAVLPSLGVGAKKLFRAESAGPAQAGLKEKISDHARALLYIYLAFTAIAMTSLLVAGMSLFDAVCHGFSVLSTGGFSTLDTSIGGYNSILIESLLIVFMLVAGINFQLFHQAIRSGSGALLRDPELRVYLFLKGLGIAAVAVNLLWARQPILTTVPGVELDPNIGQSIRASAFVGVAMQTGTGFCTADYNSWPFLSRSILIGLMLVGGCAGSTAGGIKVIRFWVVLKVMAAELEKAFRPHVVRPVKITGGVIDPEYKLGALVYVIGIIVLMFIGALVVGLLEPAADRDLRTVLTASMACLCNVGPGLGAVGPTGNYGFFSDGSKLVLSLLMALGRVEVFLILVLFTPRFWRTA